MTVAEAKVILSIDDLESLDDVFEDTFFQFKKQLLQTVPIQKLIVPKLKKLLQIQDAYLTLGGGLVEFSSSVALEFSFSSEMIASYHTYQSKKNHIRLGILNAFSPIEVFSNCQSLVELELKHASLWNSEINIEPKILLKEPDPMDVLQAMKIYKERGGATFGDLIEGKNNPPQLLIEEKNRLSLLYQKYGNHE
jgi:hypothetical protein